MGSLEQDDVKAFMKRLQILPPLFIDGGNPIDMEDPKIGRWTTFLLFENRMGKKELREGEAPYTFMGYATTYRWLTIPNSLRSKQAGEKQQLCLLPEDEEDLCEPPEIMECRERIAQFIILPPFQGKGHGSRLYSAVYRHYLKTSSVLELTVEDPSEEFDDLRDRNDLLYLRNDPDFQKLAMKLVKIPRNAGFPISQVVDTKLIESIKARSKIAPRQFARLVEMQLLSKIPQNLRQSRILVPGEKAKDDKALAEEKKIRHAYRLWRLFVKTRLHKHNREALSQLERHERVEKLDGAVATVEEGYVKTLAAVEGKSGNVFRGKKPLKRRGKNGEELDDDEEDEDDEDDASSEGTITKVKEDKVAPSKKKRVSKAAKESTPKPGGEEEKVAPTKKKRASKASKGSTSQRGGELEAEENATEKRLMTEDSETEERKAKRAKRAKVGKDPNEAKAPSEGSKPSQEDVDMETSEA